MNAESDPRRKLEAFLGMIVRVLTSPVSQSWAGRLFGREFVTPSSVYGNAHDRALAARARMLKSIVARTHRPLPQRPSGGPRLRQHHRTVRVAAAGQSPQAQAHAAELGSRSRCGAAAHPAPGRFRAGRASRDLHAAGAGGYRLCEARDALRPKCARTFAAICGSVILSLVSTASTCASSPAFLRRLSSSPLASPGPNRTKWW